MSEYDLNNPQSDVESYLANMDGILAPLPLPPESNVEKYLAHIVGVQGVELPNKPDSRVEAYLEKLALDPPQPVTPILVEKSVTENGVYSAGDDNADGYSKVTVEVPDPVLDDITITENGVYSSEHDGFDEVTVSVAPPEDSYQLKSITTPTSLATFNASEMPMPSLKVSVEAKQDLHRYDKPWVGGAGKNKLPMTVDGIKAANTSGTWSGNAYTVNDVTFTLLTDNDGNITSITANGTANGGAAYLVLDSNFNSDALAGCIANGLPQLVGIRYRVSSQYGFVSIQDIYNNTLVVANGTSLRFSIRIENEYTAINLTFYPMICLASEADATFEPYSNICPISGWSEVVVNETGINIWDEEWDLGGIDPNTGQNVSGNLVRSKNYIAVSAGTTYYFKGTGRVFYYDDQKNYISRLDRNNNEFTTPNNCKYVRFRMDASYGTTYNNDISINYPSTDTSYHAYNDTTTTISLPQTVYGGEVDVVNGVLRITKILYTKTSASYYGLYGDDNAPLFYFDISDNIKGYWDITCDSNNKLDSNYYSPISTINGAGMKDCEIRTQQATPPTKIYFRDDRFTDETSINTWLASNPLQVLCVLATPIIVPLTPTLIKSLDGINNLSVDCGDVIEGEYFKAL